MTDLDAIEARVNAATEGPWAFESCGEKGDGSNVVGVMFHPDDENAERPLEGFCPEIWDEGHDEYRDYYRDEEVCELEHRTRNAHSNAYFIAHARTDIPALIARVRKLEAMLAPPAEEEVERAAKDAWHDLCEKDDRSSPEDYPDHCLITKEELIGYIRAALSSRPVADDWRINMLRVALSTTETLARDGSRECARASAAPDYDRYDYA